MKLKLSTGGLVGVTLLAAFTVFITWRAKALEKSFRDREAPSALVNKSAPDFALVSLDGRTVSLADFRGKKKVVVAFWASWCGPCQLEMPTLQAFYERHRKSLERFEILAVSIDEVPSEAEKFASGAKLPFPVLLDRSSRIADAYGIEGIPALFVVDEQGKVVYAHEGYDMSLEVLLESELGFRRMNVPPGAPDADPGH
jgi:peroxiredoxin